MSLFLACISTRLVRRSLSVVPPRLPAVAAFCSDGKGQEESSPSSSSTLYIHVAPDGDCWTGHSIFAAKHLQPDYVRSIAIPKDLDAAALVSMLEEDPSLAQKIYDTKEFPANLPEQLQLWYDSKASTKGE